MSTPEFLRLDDGSIHHIVAVHRDERYTLYVDGAKVGSWTHLNTDASFEFRDNSGFAVFGYGLTEEQIAEHTLLAGSTEKCQCDLVNHVLDADDPTFGKPRNCPNEAEPGRTTCKDCWECVP